MKLRLSVCVFGMVLFLACNKKEPEPTEPVMGSDATVVASTTMLDDTFPCDQSFVTNKPVKIGETGIVLPVGTKLCISRDSLAIRVVLPAGFGFITSAGPTRSLPVFATYTCGCNVSGNACTVFYMEDLGFGCLQGSCGGSCTGQFTYKGYSVSQIASTSKVSNFFAVPAVQQAIADECSKVSRVAAYRKLSVYGVSFYLVNDEASFHESASCDCEGTRACTLKTLTVQSRKIYYCEGSCNGCELTVN